MSNYPTSVYINGYMRSGSTLLGMLVGRQPAVAYLGEMRNFQEYLTEEKGCYCGAHIPDCPFWREVLERLEPDLRELPTKPGYTMGHRAVKYLSVWQTPTRLLHALSAFIPPLRHDFDAIEQIARLYAAAAAHSGKSFVCDSSHRNELAKLLALYYPGAVRLLHIVRDGRGVCNSLMRRRGWSMYYAAGRWKRFNQFTMMTHRGVPAEHILRVRYEDLCREPQKEIERVCAFLGIEFAPEQTVLTASDAHFIGGSPTLRQESALALQLDEKWRKSLSRKDLQVFTEIAGSFNERYGYEQ